MSNESVYVLIDGTDKYQSFVSLLKEHFNSLKVLTSKDTLIEHIENEYVKMPPEDKTPLIFFVSINVLDNISDYLLKRLTPSGYIVSVLYDIFPQEAPAFPNIFDFINISSQEFNMTFFKKKLFAEIYTKKRMSLLQFELESFYEIGRSLSSEKDIMKLFEMIIDSSLNLTSSDAGTIYLVTDKKNGDWSSIKNNDYRSKQLKFVIAKNSSMDIRLQASTSEITTESIFGYTVITGKPLKIDDVYNLRSSEGFRHDKSYDSATGYMTKSILSMPLKDHEDNVMGVIQLINKKKLKNTKLDFSDCNNLDCIIPYDYTDILIMNSLAGQAAIVYENNLLYRDMNNLLQSYKLQNSQLEFLTTKILRAHEEERKRIAREIHDGPAQSVVNLSFRVELAKKYLQSNDPEKVTDELNSLTTNIRAVTKEIRTIIYDLKPSYLDDGLIKALENHFSIFTENTGIKVSFSVTGNDGNIEYYMSSTIYRIVQEAFTNINKHAEASLVKVSLKIKSSFLVLTIKDNGIGFDSSAVKQAKFHRPGGGFGLEGIRERVELLRGELGIQSDSGKGTKILVNVPLNSNN